MTNTSTNSGATMKRWNVILPLEGLAGSSVKNIGMDMIEAAKQFDMPVSLSMNGTHLLAFPTTTLRELQADYELQLDATNSGRE